MSNTSRKLSSDEVSALMEGLQSGEITANSGLNNDVEVSENWLKPMYLGLEEDKDIGSCQPKILSFEKKNHFEYAGASGGYLDFLYYSQIQL